MAYINGKELLLFNVKYCEKDESGGTESGGDSGNSGGMITQTLTVINSNTSETASFAMPSGYTIKQFIDSGYNVDKAFSLGEYNAHRDDYGVKYKGLLLSYESGSFLRSDGVASGTFYYEGEVASTEIEYEPNAIGTTVIINSHTEEPNALGTTVII